jgi:hypothetical protein
LKLLVQRIYEAEGKGGEEMGRWGDGEIGER